MTQRCTGCYDSFSGPWCDNCDQWPCVCVDDDEAAESEPEEATAA